MSIAVDVILTIGVLWSGFLIYRMVAATIKLKNAPRARLSVDGIELTFLFSEYQLDGNHFMRCFAKHDGFQFLMTTDRQFEDVYYSDRARIKPNMAATLEIKGELVDFRVMKTEIRSPELPANVNCFNYQGMIEHDFEEEGRYLGALYCSVCLPPDRPKRRRRRPVWKKVELPKFNLPGLMPQPVSAPMPIS